jgi:hypothetical protein
MEFGALWVGKPSLVEKIVWSSFPHNNHKLTVFVYDESISLPPGVEKADANDIVPKDRIFYTPSPNKVKQSVSPFADYFRYSMIKKTGMAWTDSDALCLSDYFSDKKYFFADDPSVGSGWVANGTIFAPKNSKLIEYLVDRVEDIVLNNNVNDLRWGALGPALLAEGIDKFNLRKYVVDNKYLHPLGFNEVSLPFSRYKTQEVSSRSKNSASLHLFNAIISEQKINKDKLQKDSYLYNKGKEFGLIH